MITGPLPAWINKKDPALTLRGIPTIAPCLVEGQGGMGSVGGGLG